MDNREIDKLVEAFARLSTARPHELTLKDTIRAREAARDLVWAQLTPANTKTQQLQELTRILGDTSYRQIEQLSSHATALANTIPAARLRAAAQQTPSDSPTAALTKATLAWFKTEFFTWVDTLPCDRCHSTRTRSIGATAPTADERTRGGAHMTELHMCAECEHVTRFARFNEPLTLLETRRGRCGEWAACFAFVCAALTLNVRRVVNTEDHVWTEVYVPEWQRWVHCDSCENAFDDPLMYETGWGKKIRYCFALSSSQVVDVTRRYSRDWDLTHQRRSVPQSAVDGLVAREVERRRRLLVWPDAAWKALRDAGEAEEVELQGLAAAHGETETETETGVGRASGNEEWRKARGELGGSK